MIQKDCSLNKFQANTYSDEENIYTNASTQLIGISLKRIWRLHAGCISLATKQVLSFLLIQIDDVNDV